MAKKLLNEAQVRRFAKLANLRPINEMYGHEDEEPMAEQEDPMDDIAVDAEEEAPMEMDAELDAEMGEEPIEMDADGAADVDLGQADVDVLGQAAEILNTIVAAAGGGDEGEEVMADLDADENEMVDSEELPGEEMPMDAEDEEEMELQEALKGIEYLPGKKEIVQEVAKRVAKRLLAAKKAEKQLQEALGNKRTARQTKRK
jgi:hypothetical protein